MNLSVIIPALNEEASIAHTLRSIYRAARVHESARAQADARAHAVAHTDETRRSAPETSGALVLRDIIVVDGGSKDDTVEEARRIGEEHPDAARLTVTTSARGRARQMNAGTRDARGDVLLFLHADTTLGRNAFSAIEDALTRGAEAGTFQLQFSPSTPLLRVYAACTRLPWTRLFFGDRGLFVTRAVFDAVGGYPDWSIFEDLELVDRLHRRTRVHLLPEDVTTSSRRFQAHGTLRQQLLNAWLWLRYLTGTPPSRLADRYRYDAD